MMWPFKKRDKKPSKSAEKQAYALGFAEGHKRTYYNAAKAGRRTSKWGERASSANAVTSANGRKLRERARHQIRNSPHANKAKLMFVSSVVGEGIRPQVRTGNLELDIEAERLWHEWTKVCDADGRHDFYGLQRLIAGTIPGDGECLIRRRPRRTEDGMSVPLQLEVLEADYLDESRTDMVGRGRIVQGVEFNALGRRVAYWLFKYHPHDVSSPSNSMMGITSSRIRASEIAHVYYCDRPGQARGVPWLAPVMMLLEDLEAYVDAEVLRKRVEACMVGIYKGDLQHWAPAYDGETGDIESVQPIRDADGVPMGDLQPGEIYHIDHEADLSIHQPSVVTGIEEFLRVTQRSIATGLGMTYELLAGDLSKVNFSSIRAGNIEWRRLARQLAQGLIVRQVCEPVWRWWLSMAIASGALPEGVEYRVDWIAPHHEEIDRVKDLQADVLGLSSGLYTMSETLKRRGKDFDQHVEELANERERLGADGVALDWLPEEEPPAEDAEVTAIEGVA